MRQISDDQRRARLARRHALAAPADSVEEAVAAVVALHATESTSVYLSAWARTGCSRTEVDRALYEDRTVVRQLAMRRTVFAFPRDLVPAVAGSAAARVAGQQLALLAKDARAAGLTTDGAVWARTEIDGLHALIEREGPVTTAQVRELLPHLASRITRGKGNYQAEVAIARQVVTALAATGAIVRGPNDGTWKTLRPRWALAEEWLGEEPRPLEEQAGYAEMVRRWLERFGPGTEDDIVWWLGATKGAVRRALADVDAVEVGLEGDRTGFVLPVDLDDDPKAKPWAALLPALDPTLMGWKERGFYLGDHAESLFDRNGNGGPSAWWNGRVVGGWSQRDDGEVFVVPAETLPKAATSALDKQAKALTEWFEGDVVRSIYQSPLARAAASSSST